MTDLIEFLRARLDEDEQTALAASPGPWKPNAESDEVLAVDDERVADGFALSGRQLRATVEHIARHDPARVLREVEAKRRILELYDVSTGRELKPDAWELMKHAVRALAEPCADHPDYREEWRP